MRLTVVIATFNRGRLLLDLLNDLARQQSPGPFEVIVVDDGSNVPVSELVEGRSWPFPLKVLRQANAGQASARHRGILAASGELIVITDDDMQLSTDFLQAHLDEHDRGADVVLGLMRPANDLADKPLFERFHAASLEDMYRNARRGPVQGAWLCTGNVSFSRRLYMELGGFDMELKRSEDRELGIRFEKAGARLAFSDRAYTLHGSDHTDLSVWKRRAFLYGVYDHRISRKHPENPEYDPWHFLYLVNPVSRPLLLATVAIPTVGGFLADRAMHASVLLDRLGLERVAVMGTTLVYGLEYFRGLRSEYGSFGEALRGLAGFREKRRRAAHRE